MDPTTAWQWLQDAIDVEDWPGARDHIRALDTWRSGRGFVPSQEDVEPFEPFDTHDGTPDDIAEALEIFNSWIMAAHNAKDEQ